MSQEGFLFGELSEFKQDLMRSIKNDFPKEKFHEAIKSDSSFVLKNPPTYTTRTKADEENDKNELYLKKVDYDLDEDINVPVGFKKVGNIYDLIFDTNDERDNK